MWLYVVIIDFTMCGCGSAHCESYCKSYCKFCFCSTNARYSAKQDKRADEQVGGLLVEQIHLHLDFLKIFYKNNRGGGKNIIIYK